MHMSVFSSGLRALVIGGALFTAACDFPVDDGGAAGASIRDADFSTPTEAVGRPGTPTRTTERAARATAPQAQLYFGTEPITARTEAAPPAPTDGYRLNFDGASLREVVDVILGELLGVNYTIDPAIDGSVVLASTAPLSAPDLLTVLETILQMHGATLVDLGGTYAVMIGAPQVGAVQISTVGGEQPPPLIVGTGVTVVPLRYINASSAAQFIQPMLSLPEQIRVDDSRNLVLFVGTAAERQNVLRTLDEIDVDWMAGRSVGIFPLQTATPQTVIPELEGLFTPLDAFSDQASGVRFLPMARLNAVIVIASQPNQLVEAERWIQRLDRGSGSSMQFFVYQLDHTPAAEMAKLLNESFGDALQSGPTVEQVGFDNAFDSGIQNEFDNTFETDIALPPDNGGVGGIIDQPFGATLPGDSNDLLANVKVVPDLTANALVIRATPQAFNLIEDTIRRLDRAPLQVLIEATIAEVVLNDLLRYGVQYYFSTGSFQGGFNTSSPAGNTASNSLLSPLAALPGFNFIFTPGNSNITIDALSRVTDVQVLSSPSLVVQDNSEAILTVGEEVPLITRTTQGIENPAAPIVANIEYRDTGVILEVRPRINTNNVVTLEIAQEVSRVQPTERRDENPTITQRRIASKVNVTSGQTVVLGGLIQDSSTDSTDKVPVLGDIPVLGNLFRSTSNQSVRTELIVFITPRVIRNSEDARIISEELRSQMRSALPPESERGRPVEPAPAPSELTDPAEQIPPPAADPRPLTTSRETSAAATAETVSFAVDETPLPAPRPIPGDLVLPTARPERTGIAL